MVPRRRVAFDRRVLRVRRDPPRVDRYRAPLRRRARDPHGPREVPRSAVVGARAGAGASARLRQLQRLRVVALERCTSDLHHAAAVVRRGPRRRARRHRAGGRSGVHGVGRRVEGGRRRTARAWPQARPRRAGVRRTVVRAHLPGGDAVLTLERDGVQPHPVWAEWAGPWALLAWDGRALGPSSRWHSAAMRVPIVAGVETFSAALDETVSLLAGGAVSPWWRCSDRCVRDVVDEVHDGRTHVVRGIGRCAPEGSYGGGRWTPSSREDPHGYVTAHYPDGRSHCRTRPHVEVLVRRALHGLPAPRDVLSALRECAMRRHRDIGAPSLVSVGSDDLLRMRGRAACWECDGHGQGLSGPCGACGGGGVAS